MTNKKPQRAPYSRRCPVCVASATLRRVHKTPRAEDCFDLYTTADANECLERRELITLNALHRLSVPGRWKPCRLHGGASAKT